METPTVTSSAPPARSRSAASLLRTSGWVAGVLVLSSITPWCVAEARSAINEQALAEAQAARATPAVSPATASPGTASPEQSSANRASGAPEPQRAVLAADQGMPQTSQVLQPPGATEPAGLGQYTIGIAVLLLAGVLTAGALYALLVVLLMRTWGDHAHAHVGARPHH